MYLLLSPKATINAYASKGFEALQPVLNNESKIESKKIEKIANYLNNKGYKAILVGGAVTILTI